jgi:hypothetical protein
MTPADSVHSTRKNEYFDLKLPGPLHGHFSLWGSEECTRYIVPCTLYNVMYTLYTACVHIMYTVLRKLYTITVMHMLYTVLCSFYIVLYNVYNSVYRDTVLCTLYTAVCTLFTVCTVNCVMLAAFISSKDLLTDTAYRRTKLLGYPINFPVKIKGGDT